MNKPAGLIFGLSEPLRCRSDESAYRDSIHFDKMKLLIYVQTAFYLIDTWKPWRRSLQHVVTLVVVRELRGSNRLGHNVSNELKK